MNLDSLIFYTANNLAGISTILDKLAIFFAQYSGYFLMAILLILLLRDFKKHKEMALVAFGSSLLARILVEVIRFLYPKNRPFVERTVNLLIQHPPTSAFPSGHASFYFALSVGVFLYNKKLGLLFILVSALMGMARVFSGLHWPSDILAGIVLGSLTAFFVKKFYLWFLNKSGDGGSRTLTG